MVTVCAFANEPNAGGGYLLLGVAQSEHPDLQRYEVSGIVDTDKMQQDVASQCNTIFNKPLRVEMQVEKLEGEERVEELAAMLGASTSVTLESAREILGTVAKITSTI